jgi:plasmid stabilization system protein ParE
LIGFTARAARQLQQLRSHYESLERPEAVQGLVSAVEEASRKIEANHSVGLVAPRPYPHLARAGQAWIKVDRYWISYSTTKPTLIIAVFHDTANIPGRF